MWRWIEGFRRSMFEEFVAIVDWITDVAVKDEDMVGAFFDGIPSKQHVHHWQPDVDVTWETTVEIGGKPKFDHTVISWCIRYVVTGHDKHAGVGMMLDDLTKSLSNNRGGLKAVYSPFSIDWIVSCEWKLHASQVTTLFDMLTDLLTLTLANLVLPRYGQAEISPPTDSKFSSLQRSLSWTINSSAFRQNAKHQPNHQFFVPPNSTNFSGQNSKIPRPQPSHIPPPGI